MNGLLDKIRGMELRYLYLLMGALIALVTAVDIVTGFRFQWKLLGALDKKNVQIRRDITELTANRQRLAMFRSQLEAARAGRKEFDALVWGRDELPEVLQKISSIANEYGVKIDQLAPHPLDSVPIVKTGEGKYFAQGITLRVRAGYHPFARFISHLERERMFWQLDDFVIASSTQDLQRQDIHLVMKIVVLDK